MKIVAATHNENKLREMQQLLGDADVHILTTSQLGLGVIEVEETGSTFEENAAQKAEAICRATGLPALADDSGLAVDALGGAPGVHSARYAGQDGDSRANNAKLLQALQGIPDQERTARFVTVMTLVTPEGRRLVTRGECPGSILMEARGEGGFGYDPLFVPQGRQLTFAQMSAAEKNSISHRSLALVQLKEALASW